MLAIDPNLDSLLAVVNVKETWDRQAALELEPITLAPVIRLATAKKGGVPTQKVRVRCFGNARLRSHFVKETQIIGAGFCNHYSVPRGNLRDQFGDALSTPMARVKLCIIPTNLSLYVRHGITCGIRFLLDETMERHACALTAPISISAVPSANAASPIVSAIPSPACSTPRPRLSKLAPSDLSTDLRHPFLKEVGRPSQKDPRIFGYHAP
jgi:hypothetical protein